MRRYKALTIAGSDSSGGAGIQADLKTFQELGVYGMSVITAVTAQNTLGVHGVYPMEASALSEQLDAIGEDMKPDAVKTGMLFSSEFIEIAAAKIKYFQWQNLIIDPVMIAKGGSALLQQNAIQALITHLLPLAFVITPNIPEAELLARMPIQTLSDREEAALRLFEMGSRYVIIKGGHTKDNEELVDLIFDGSHYTYLEGKRISTPHTHGTGCTFSAALTAEIAQGKSIEGAIKTAKAFIQSAIEDQLGFGAGHGPTNHFAYQQRLRSRQ